MTQEDLVNIRDMIKRQIKEIKQKIIRDQDKLEALEMELALLEKKLSRGGGSDYE